MFKKKFKMSMTIVYKNYYFYMSFLVNESKQHILMQIEIFNYTIL